MQADVIILFNRTQGVLWAEILGGECILSNKAQLSILG